MWRDEYNEWKKQHDFKVYKTRDKIDEVIVDKLATMLDDMEQKLTSDNSDHAKCKHTQDCKYRENICLPVIADKTFN